MVRRSQSKSSKEARSNIISEYGWHSPSVKFTVVVYAERVCDTGGGAGGALQPAFPSAQYAVSPVVETPSANASTRLT